MKKVALTLATGLFLAATSFATGIEGDKETINTTASTVTWKGEKVTGQHEGTLALKSGVLETKNGKIASGSFELDMTSIACTDIDDAETNGNLVGHLKSQDFFNVAEYETASFVITNSKAKKGENGANHEITGDLTIKGITNSITFPATVTVKDGVTTASAAIVFDRTKWSIKYGSGSFFDNLGDKVIYDDVTLNVNLTTAK